MTNPTDPLAAPEMATIGDFDDLLSRYRFCLHNTRGYVFPDCLDDERRLVDCVRALTTRSAATERVVVAAEACVDVQEWVTDGGSYMVGGEAFEELHAAVAAYRDARDGGGP